MCTNLHWQYNKYIRRSVLVPCGKCPSCLQSKADARARRIKNNVSFGTLCLMVTLTYDNKSIPFIYKSDLVNKKDVLTVHRSFDSRYKRVSKNVYKLSRFERSYDDYLDVFQPDYTPDFDGSKVRSCTHASEKVGVSLYSDIQKFFKRLRLTLKRHYDFDKNFSYWSCTEYGGTYHRPHAHLLLFIPADAEKTFRSAIRESWSYDDSSCPRLDIQIARDAASYVASYVNSNSYLPSLLKDYFPQKHSCSKNFGVMLDCFSLGSILEKARRVDMSYTLPYIDSKTNEFITLPIPEYVISRHFPKFKGYSLCDSSTLYQFFICPSLAKSNFQQKLGLSNFTNDDFHKWKVCITNSFNRYNKYFNFNKTIFDYFIDYEKTWSAYNSYFLKQSHVGLSNEDYYSYYDNIYGYLSGRIHAPTLDDYDKSLFVVSPAEVPFRVRNTIDKSAKFHRMTKQKNVTNYVMTSLGHNV